MLNPRFRVSWVQILALPLAGWVIISRVRAIAWERQIHETLELCFDCLQNEGGLIGKNCQITYVVHQELVLERIPKRASG